MVTSINASSLNLQTSQYQASNFKTNVTSSQDEKETEKTSSVVTTKSQDVESESSDGSSVTKTADGDTLSLSKEGLKMSTGNAGASTSDSTSSSSSSDLSGYSDSQLKSMLTKGEITQAEYNKEIKSRATDETEITDTTTQALQNSSALVSQLNVLV